jgi:hypothetical protein
MLGRIVSDFYSPLNKFTPESPTSLLPELISSSMYSTDENNATLVLNSTKHGSLRACLEGLLSLSTTSSRGEQLSLSSTLVRTWRLANFENVFSELVNTEEVRRKLSEIVPIGGKAYFVMGVMTCFNANVTYAKSSDVGVSGEVNIPVAKIAAAATGVPLLIDGEGLALGIDQSRNKSRDLTATASGEEVFAVEYRVVRRSWAGLGKRVVLRDDNLQTKAGLKFGGSGDEKDEDEEGIDDVALTTESLNPKNAREDGGVGPRNYL